MIDQNLLAQLVELQKDVKSDISDNLTAESLDKEEIYKIEVIQRNYVLFKLPTLYNNIDVDKPNVHTDSIRACKYEDLINLIDYIEIIEKGNQRQQIQLIKTLTNKIIEEDPRINKIGLQFIDILIHGIEQIGIEENHISIKTNGICFDAICKYEFDDDNLLTNVTYLNYEQYTCYSQIKDPSLITQIRNYYNDTDYARIQYALIMFRDTLLFTTDRSYTRILNLINLYLFHILLVTISNPVKNLSANNLLHHYIGNIFDTIIRSRHYDAWFKAIETPHMIMDIKNNYHQSISNMLVGSAKDRFEQFISNISQLSPKIKNITKFDKYIEILNKMIIKNDDNYYYYIDESLLPSIFKTETFNLLQNELYQQSSE